MQDEELDEVVPTPKASVKASTPVKAQKKPFGHHGGKPGLPFCTMEGMGQVSNPLMLSLMLAVVWLPVLTTGRMG